ncbi:MAG TPA: hypothetical protein VK508_19275 [Cyclobacteriaceae bacterium]|nr:hypothetical protein [Cyclobacteriaceae bacterium]
MKKLLCFLLLTPVIGLAQQFVAEAPLPAVDKAGFYNIPLPPGITALLESDLRNIRIVDEKGMEVPYIIQADQPVFSNVEFIEYNMQKTRQKDCCTVLTLINHQKDQISNIILDVKNAETTKEATLRGSDDQQSWYALKERFTLGDFSNSRATSKLSILDFPLSNYVYYQIVINDSTTAPLNIIKAGYYNVSTDYGVYVEVPSVTITSADSVKDKTTWAVIHFDTTQFVDKIEFGIAGPPFYKRDATLFQKDHYYVKRVKKEYLNPVKSFNLISTQQASVTLSMKTPELVLRVSNGDNPRLEFKGVKVWQLKRSLTAWLPSGNGYRIVVGSDSLQAPVYDLEFFRDSIPDKPTVLQPGDVKKFIRPVEASATPTFFTNRNIIWIAIAIVVVILGAMSMRMIREKSDQ